MDAIHALAHRCRVANPSDTVLHNECAFTFYNPFSTDQGIVVNMNTFMGTVPRLAFAGNPSGNRDIFLRIVKKRLENPSNANTIGDGDGGNDNDTAKRSSSDKKQPFKLAIGVEGGFSTDDDRYETITQYSLVVMENSTNAIVFEMNLDEDTRKSLPEAVTKSADSIIHHAGMSIQQDLVAWEDDEEIQISNYHKDLPFVDNGVQISPDPKLWKCEKSGDAENLWLNLSDGFIGGGRRNWDGSGGSNGALDHFNETGEKYPLVVKLGTIHVEGSIVHADCFSYANDECGPVNIPNLDELLRRRGIAIGGLQKIVKSTAELEVLKNLNYAFDAITESNSKLVAVSGPELQGLVNLGNTCYCNSVMQVLCASVEITNRYGTEPKGDITNHRFFKGISPSKAIESILTQTSKLISALKSGAYAIPKEELDKEGITDPKYRVAPRMFKHLIGKNNIDFRTFQQQDAAQFLQYFLEQIDRAEGKYDRNLIPTSNLFSFQTQTRMVCSADQKIKYKDSATETMLSLPIPMEKAEIIEPEQKKRKQEGNDNKDIPTIKFSQCLDSWSAETSLTDFRWSHLHNTVHPGTQVTRFKTFPKYMWVQLQLYKLDQNWQPVKVEVNLDIPESIDLTSYKANGPQKDECLVPDDDEKEDTADSVPAFNEGALAQLMDMGLGMNGCKRALIAVGGSDTEAAMSHYFEHNTDPNFNDPLPDSNTSASSGPSDDVDDSVVMSLVENLGMFTIDQVRAALKETNGAADRAADWLFSHMDDLDSAISNLQGNVTRQTDRPKISLDDGEGKYNMIGMISHIGKNTGSGHYVAHVKKGTKWVIFNDEKVAISEHPPFQHAYLYLFQRDEKDKSGS